MPQLIAILAVVYGLYSCNNDTDSDGLLKCDRYEEVDVNVYFYFEDNSRDYYLGTVTDASAYAALARKYAYEKSIENSAWSYICIATDGKHRIC